MAFPNVTFTEDGRVKTAKVLGIIQWICIAPAILCLLTALYIQLVIADKISFIENYNGHALPGILVFTGAFSFLCHILCGKAFWANYKPEKREKWAKFLLPAVIVTLLIFVLELIAGILCVVHVGELEDSLESGILNAMKSYKNDLTTKEEMDMLQIEYACCGSRSYEDWFRISWVHPDYMSKQAKLLERQNDVPFSCCSPHVLRPCIYHRVEENDQHYNYDFRVKTTLYEKGCAAKLTEFYENTLLSNGGAVILGLSFIQLIVGAVGRIFQTALSGSMDSDDKQAVSIGYLFGEVSREKSADLDTTTETVDTGTTEDQTVTNEESFEETAQALPEEPAYMPMGGMDFPREEPIYENLKPYQDDEEHIYHDEEVEQYLLNKYNQSKHYFETLSNEPSPGVDKRESVIADVSMSLAGAPIPSGSGVYDEPLPYPPDESDTPAGERRGSIRKQSSVYVSFDPAPGTPIGASEPIYENIRRRSLVDGTGNGPYDIPRSNHHINNSSVAANNRSKNHYQSVRGNNIPLKASLRISQSQIPHENIWKTTGQKRSKSDSKNYNSISDTVKSNNLYATKTVKSNLYPRRSSKYARPENTYAALQKPRTEISTFGPVDKYKRQYDLNIRNPLIPKTKYNQDDNFREFKMKEQVQNTKAREPLHSSIKRYETSGEISAIIQARRRPCAEETKRFISQQNSVSKSLNMSFPRPDVKEMTIQPENYASYSHLDDIQKSEYGSTNIRTSHDLLPCDNQIVYQSSCATTHCRNRDSATGENSQHKSHGRETRKEETLYSRNDTPEIRFRDTQTDGYENKENTCRRVDFTIGKRSPLHRIDVAASEREADVKYDAQYSFHRAAFALDKRETDGNLSTENPFHSKDIAADNKEVDDTGIYINSLSASANKSSNSVTVGHIRSQSLSPIFPVMTAEPMSPKKQDESSDNGTVIISLVPHSTLEAGQVTMK